MMYKHLFSILALSTVIASTASARYIRWEEFSDERFISYVATLTKLGSPQINLQDSSTGRTPLIEAVVRNLPDCVHKLLTLTNQRVIVEASIKNNPEALDGFLDELKRLPDFVAIQVTDEKVIAEVNINKNEDLVGLKKLSYCEVKPLPNERLIDVNIKDNDGFTALMHAIKDNRCEIVRILLLNVNHRIMKYFAPDSLEYKTLSKHRANAYKSDIPEQVTNYARSRFITHKS